MTSVNLPRDDAGLRIDPKTVAKRDVKQAEAYPEVQPVKEHDENQAPVAPVQRREPRKRRQGDRRQKDVPVLLDTRSGGDRRRQDKDDDEGPAEHIDVRV